MFTKKLVRFFVFGLAIFAVTEASAIAEPAEEEGKYAPNVGSASKDGEQAIQGFRKAPGLKIELFAAEPLVANPVSLSLDEHNRLYVAETFRYHAGVTDTRRHMYWLNEDLAAQTVEDRIAMYRKYLGKALATYSVEHDRIRRIEDRDGDGRADQSTIFADGFNGIEEGFGAGVLARRNEVWYTCIPRLWKFRDTNDDGRADERKALHHGYGVHVSYLGHDMHGLRQGPDGKLYFSIGDRGLNVRRDDGRQVTELDSGSVLRCNPDGTELELFATGLRNPQELAFDEHGNLFTCDNNSDGGDKARWVYVVEGGDSGWRIGYQYLETPMSRGPWNHERLWDPKAAKEAAYLVPPIANISDGPSGLTYDPGTGMSEHYRRHFFLCDFRGTASQSGIRTFKNQARGASFELVDREELAWGILATDVDFGTDGSLYVSDWVEKFSSPAKGRIYRISTTSPESPIVQEVKTLLAEGMSRRSQEQLVTYLAHPDVRVRLDAQFELAKRGKESLENLGKVAREPGSRLARLHAIWGLGQIGRQAPAAYELLVGRLTDADAEVRAQAAKVLGEGRFSPAYTGLVSLLKDERPRVRFFAAIALGKLQNPEATAPLLAMLRENQDQDAYLRHAGVMGLSGAGSVEALLSASNNDSSSVRLGILLALRRLHRPEVAKFLNDRESSLVLEAARAINDVPIEAAMPQLAALADRSNLPPFLVRRVLNANFRLGGEENAKALVTIASDTKYPASIRVEAIDALGRWANPPGRDLIMGLWRPIPSRPADPASKALPEKVAPLSKEAPEALRQAIARASGNLGIKSAAPELLTLITDTSRAGATRVEALHALQKLEAHELGEAVERAAADRDGRLRAEGLKLIAKLRPDEAVRKLSESLERDSLSDRQSALKILGTIAGPKADEAVTHWLDRLNDGNVPSGLALDILNAARERHSAEIDKKLTTYESKRPKDDPLANYLESLEGGNTAAGRKIFFEKTAAQCVRCHKIGGRGGEVGPDLSDIGIRRDRRSLLTAIVDPDREIAQGFETRVVATAQGQVHVGLVKAEDQETLTLISLEGKLIKIPKAEIEEQKKGKSGMPDDLIKVLPMGELRDLVEFLANQKKR